MKLYNKATKMQRFLAFLIDALVIGLVTFGISALILFCMGFSFDGFFSARSEYTTDTMLYYYYGDGYTEAMTKALTEYNGYATEFYLVFDSVALVLVILYLVVLPYFWEKQTLGRLALKIRVISHKGTIKADIKKLILREIVGTWLIYILLYAFMSGFPIVISAICAMLCGRSIIDLIAGTDLVMKDPVEIDPEVFKQFHRFDDDSAKYQPNPDEFRSDEKKDYIDAEVKDETPAEEPVDNDSKDEPSDDSDEEYRVF